ncbi:hypothetical protein DMH04_18265 [Kibdelosporangium aridum]|uniref:Uncharacterized protein n=1 Tax=Kibdelosporangium aridum TaxID=2030 RepID=A0A428ZAZ4_KIBAR|nr:hypothetical protein [Kibdelosporangium aridum]RSM85235.1 hypothetical protein DMH04_18265 [Kibdelosporangium aridum]
MAESDLPVEVTTLICDPLRDDVLLRLAGPVMLPPGSLVELADGTVAGVSSVRLNAADGHHPELIMHVTRSCHPARDSP